ncbi:uroporphyrin-III C-methyltransferase/precorrin-2 dehydrogenase/sirohydrochlorin ferrochelatase [Dietzia sp. 2505]|uniref:NAD(P)-dependent oxidoreductase n=1 Tax=Dietzia sp. 2505 TaxID=3156457 RepID=UPI0033933037
MTIAFADAAPAAERPAVPALDGLPLTVGLSAREVLVVGAGPVSVRRAETFLEAGAVVRVVAPRVDPAMADLAARAGAQLVVVVRNFRASDLDTPWMVHVATGDPVVDAEVADLCEQRRIWCVAAGDAALGSARVPARTAVSTPAGLVRIAVDSSDPRRSVRVGRHVARSLATAPAGLRARRRPEAGWLVLVGGCGDGDLLTVRARRFVHAADVLVVDGAADPGLLAEIDDDVEVIEVGSTLPVDAVARVVAARCAAGHGVVRIVAADTLADRARDLRAAGVTFEIVPGVVDGGA